MTIPQLFERSVNRFPNNSLVWEKDATKTYQPLSYSLIKNRVLDFANGLLSLGITKDDRLALLAEGRSEWLISELGMLYIGAINVPLSIKINEPSDLSFRIKHSGCKFVVVSERQIPKIRGIKPGLSEVEKYIILTDTLISLDDNEISYSQVCELGRAFAIQNPKLLEQITSSLENNQLANISYTSGTTADPKGIMLSHRNYTANVEQAKSLLKVHEYYSSLLILPWDHSFGHTVGLYTLIDNGASLSVVEMGATPMETLRIFLKTLKR